MTSKSYSAQPLTISSNLQHLALKINIPELHPLPITLCSIYIPPSHNTCAHDILPLTFSLPPFILCGDFNAHSATWGVLSNQKFQTNSRGNIIDQALTSNPNLLLLNTPGVPTHLNSSYGTLSSIDLSFCSPSLASSLTWATHPDLCDSDHYPIILSSDKILHCEYKSVPRWIYQKADWPLFYNLTSHTSSLPDCSNIEDSLTALTNLITDSAKLSIPLSSGIHKPGQVPWWSQEIYSAIKTRRNLSRNYQSTKSLEDFIKYKKAKARARALIRLAKKRSWNSYVAGINKPQSPSAMWKDIKRLAGSPPNHSISQLKSDSTTFYEPQDICELLASHFSSVSADYNYDTQFRSHKIQAESLTISFQSSSASSLPYNLPITPSELHTTIQKNLKNASPGPDKIHASMLKNLHPNSLTYLLSLFNSILRQGTYPLLWKLAIIFPILKPTKDPSLPSSYRPIALTSVLGKLFQKTLNKRLFWFLESNNLLSPSQYGFRKGRNSLQALADLNLQIEEANRTNSNLYTIFFDLQEAFPRVWRHYICTKLHEIGLRGNLPNLLQSFLHDRSLTVRIQNIFSSHKLIQNGVPQGEVWSVPLFLIAINDLSKCVTFPLSQRLFADDFSISLSSTNPNRAIRLLQLTLDKISSWSSERGFRFSSHKTVMVVFQKRSSRPLALPPLFLQNFQINLQPHVKFLGITFDSKTSWTPHLKILRAKCLQSLNTLKYLSHPRTGCNRKLLLQLYNSLIRSRLDYGSPIFSHTYKTPLKLLDSIQSSALRIATGALRTSPTLSLCAETGEPPLRYRFLSITANFLASTAQFPTLPIFSTALNHQNSLLHRLESHLHKHLKLNPLLPLFPSTPPWLTSPPDIRLDLTDLPKSSNSTYREFIKNIISSDYPTHLLCFTDGSKSGPKTGYAFSIQGIVSNHRIRNSASIFTAELLAIFSCLSQLTLLSPPSKFLILSDSLSSLLAIQHPYSSNPIIQRIHVLLHSLSSTSILVTFLWIPGHIDLPDHDAVDHAAKQSLLFPSITDPSLTPAYDLKSYYRSLISNSWKKFWHSQSSNKLHLIKKTPVPWSTSNRTSRYEEVLLARLRIGHTRLSHAFLYLGLHSPPSCQYCNQDELSVEHFFSCPALENSRKTHSVSSSLATALSNNSDAISKSLNYLRSTYFFSSI